MKGTVSVIDIPRDSDLPLLTEKVIKNNFKIEYTSGKNSARESNPVPLYGGEKESPIQYIVFISKENRTFDEVFGQVKGAHGDPSLARYGRGVSFSNSSWHTFTTSGEACSNQGLYMPSVTPFRSGLFQPSRVTAGWCRELGSLTSGPDMQK